MRTVSHVWRMTMRAGLGLAVLVLLLYAWSPIYRFPDPTPYAGAQILNPYASLGGTWQRANMHAHGEAWAGITNGRQSDEEVVRRYRLLGYTVAGVSDYQRIAAFHGVDTLPLYEHGYNIGKNHQLAVGAHAVEWFDLPLWQTASNQQYVIDRIRRKADLVSLNHPGSRGAYDADAMSRLTGYKLIEVVNGPFTAANAWDAALSAGRAVWAIGNDDTHDLDNVRRSAVGWTMIDAPTASTSDIVGALRAGRSYAVLRTGALGAANVTTLQSVQLEDRTLTVRLNGAPSTITFIGQNGAVRRSEDGASSASYTLTDADTYVRTVVTSPQTILFLNPVIRWNGSSLPEPAATVDAALTWSQRGGIAGLVVLLACRMRARRAHAARSPALNTANLTR
jgi:hypothetical protein